MDTTRQDFVVGIVLVAAIAVVIGALIATSGWGERRYDLYMRAASAQGLTVDTKVLVQGLVVGRVTSILPRVDPTTRSVSFLARLSLAERFDKGTQLRLPVGTRAEVDQVSQISAEAVIHLVMPDSTHRSATMLQAGDTINSTRLPSPLDALADVAAHLSKEVEDVLHQTRTALATVQRTVGNMDETMRHVTPDVEATLHSVAASTNRLTNLLARTDQASSPIPSPARSRPRTGCWDGSSRWRPRYDSGSTPSSWTSTRTPTPSRPTSWKGSTGAPGTSWWWVTTRRPSIRSGQPPSATSWSSPSASREPGWSAWSRATGPPHPSWRLRTR